MKTLCGLSDSLAGVVENPAKCPHCAATSWVSGLCVNCLLRTGLDQASAASGTESLQSLLAEVNVPDQNWRLGNYEILEEVGRGGMGVIYRARQRHSRRIVAVKRVLSYHADSRERLERFRREAEAAASLDHPNILPIYEVSESEEGLPYFSMKFATGGSLREAAHLLRSDPRQCVALVAKVTRATSYAHGQGILHRDLKPGNILLDGRVEPLVSDFGLAKWLDATSDLTRTLTTFGTPGYIAPEQAEGRASDLTSAADVYSLGALLFDLLTGRPPFMGEHALSVIRQAAENPSPKLRSLVRSLDRDLETICARCLEREPQARYHSAEDLAEDLDRWLDGRPILARRVFVPVRIWRWSRRNPKLVATAAACLLFGAASIWVLRPPVWTRQFSIFAKNILSPQAAAEESKLREALIEYPEIGVEAQYSHLGWETEAPVSIEERLYSRLAARVRLDQKSLSQKLSNLAETLKRDLDAPLYERACAVYLGRDYAESERLSLKAADEYHKAGVPRRAGEINALNLAAWSAYRSSDFARAMDHLREAEKLTDRRLDPREWADIQCTIGSVLLEGQAAEAEKAFEHVIEVRTQVFGPANQQTLFARRRRASALLDQGKYSEAESEYRQLIELDEKTLGPEHPETLWSRWDLGYATDVNNAGKIEESFAEKRAVLQLREKVLGPEHRDTLRSRGSVANGLEDYGLNTEAIAERRKLLMLQRKVLGPEDNATLNTLRNLGACLAGVGESEEGEAMLREAVRLREKTVGAAHGSTLDCRQILTKILMLQGRSAEAEGEARAIIQLKETTVGVERAGWAHGLLGVVLDTQGRHTEAEAQIRQALRIYEKLPGSENINARGKLARNLSYQGKNVDAEALLRELIVVNEKILGATTYTLENNVNARLDDAVTPFVSRTLLANTLRDQQKYAEAETEYKQVIELEEKVLGPDHPDTLDACYNYAYQLGQQGKIIEAKVFGERAAKGAAKVMGATDPRTREYSAFLTELERGRPIILPEVKFHDSLLAQSRILPQASP